MDVLLLELSLLETAVRRKEVEEMRRKGEEDKENHCC